MLTFLAPMDDVTDTVFRRIVADCAEPDFTVTEFVNVDALCSRGRNKVIRKLGVELDNSPVIAQIWGKEYDNFETIAYELSEDILGDFEYESWLARELGSSKASTLAGENRNSRTDGTVIETRIQLARRFAETVRGANSHADGQTNRVKFSGIDLNFGCPAKSELKNQCCSALQKFELRDRALSIIQATQKGALEGRNKLPVSFKTRLGFDDIDYSWHEFLLQQKPSILTVHVRTTKQMSKVPAQWDAIKPILKLRDKISPKTKIIMNGDILNRTHGEEIVMKYGVDGVMIGRGIFHDPYCFADVEPTQESPWHNISREDRIELFKKHVKLHDEVYPDGQRPFNPLKKFAKVYISDFPGAAELRDKIMHTESVSEVLKLL